jgi:hypothetical protein
MSRATTPKNPWVGRTYIPDNARMETPPAWFLQALHDYDAELVLFPSRAKPFAYVIARRCRLGRRGLTGNAIAQTITQPDTKMVMAHGCVPVCLMFKHGPVWKVEGILASLRARDIWRHGGADQVADDLEAAEAKEVADRREAKREELWHLSGEAYRSYQARTGQSTLKTVGRASSSTPTGGVTAP